MKKGISILLILSIILSCGIGFPMEVNASSTDPFTATVQGKYTVKAETQEISILIELPGITSPYTGFGIDDGIISIPEGFQLISYSTSNTSKPLVLGTDYFTNTGVLSYQSASNKNDIPADTTYTAVFSAPANASGDFQIVFGLPCVTDETGNYVAEMEELSVNFSIDEYVAPAGEYEIFYKLDSTTDVEDTPDKYMEYAYDATVSADVYIRNNTDEDVSLQAYDFYVEYSAENLICGNFTPANDQKGAKVEDANGKARIQAIGANTTKADINITLPKNDDEGVKLGTINFTFGPNAEYEQELPITLTSGSKEQGNTSTNISVANIVTDSETTGNKESYYPVNASEVLGAEINTKHAITWVDEDGTTELYSARVGHNVMPVYGGETPTKDPTADKTYTFNEWTPAIVKATADATYTATYTEEVNTYTVTWNNWDGTLLDTDEVEHGEIPSYTGAEPTKNADNKYTYAFANQWDPAIEAATEDAAYTAVFTATPIPYKITFDVGEGSLPDGYTSPMDYNCDQSKALPLPTWDGYVFNGWKPESAAGSWTEASYDENDTVYGMWGDVKLVADWIDVDFEVKIDDTIENGTVSADPKGGAEGTQIALTAKPNPGYKLDKYIVTHTDDPAQNVEVADDGTFKLPAADVTVTATFVLDDLTVNVENPTDANGTVSADKETAKAGETVTLSNDPDDGYELKEYKVTYTDPTTDETVDVPVSNGTFEMPNYPVTVTATFQLKELVITIDGIQNGSVEAQKDSVKTETAKLGEMVTLVVTPNNGYKLVTDSLSVTKTGDSTQTVPVTDGTFEMPAYDVTVTARFELDTYTIIFDLDGGNDLTGDFAGNERTYTIDDTWALPTPTKANYVFNGWKVKETVGSWTKDAVHGPGTTNLNQAYGNVTLIAQWIPRGDLKVEEYKYAADGYVMLRVADAGLAADQVYQFGTGADATMYYTTDSNYLVEDSNATGVYYTLISKAYAEKQTDENGNVLKDENGIELITGKLTTEGLKLLQAVPGLPASINYDTGDINGDTKTNIADANIVYQMIVNGGGYYGDLKITERLAADMNRAAEGVHRGSIEDVAAIMAIINGTN